VILQRLEAELDALWSFVGKKAHRHGGWMAKDAPTPQVSAFPGGDRSGQSAQAWWEQIPTVSQEHALCYPDQYAVYTGGIPSAQHRAISTLARKTNPVERFNCPRRPRGSRLGRVTLAFSKKLSTHSGAVKYFIRDYNLTKCAALPE